MLPANAAGGMELSGSYRLSNVVANSDQVQVTANVRLTNHGNTKVSLQQPVLHFRFSHPQPPQKLNAIALPPRGTVELTQQLTVDARAYRDWANREPLLLSFITAGANGDPTASTLRLHPLQPAPHIQVKP